MVALSLLVAAVLPVAAVTRDLGNGFADHGVAAPVNESRGTVATIDGQGRDVVLVWLGGHALLMIDADTGKGEQFPLPFDPGQDSPYASLLSTGNKFYTHFNSHFCEFDPVKRAFTFCEPTAPQMAMSMTQDDRGVIWSATYPQNGVVSFNPKTREFRDYGHVYKQDWAQYPRSVEVDSAGWVYLGIGQVTRQIVAFDPKTAQANPLIPEAQRRRGSGHVFCGTDGKVYGRVADHQWVDLRKGKGGRISETEPEARTTVITGAQDLFHQSFPDGRRLVSCDVAERILVVEDPKTGQSKPLRFDYTSAGARIMAVAAAPDGTICGGTGGPARSFRYDPKTDQWTHHAAYGQWNTMALQGDRVFIGGYTGGFLLEWDPSRAWVWTERGKKDSNPLFLTESVNGVYRPHELVAHSDGRTLVLAGSPDYGLTGGGLLFWDRRTRQQVLVEHTDIIPEHTTMSLVALPNRKLLGGTSTRPGSGGERKAKEAELYRMDMTTRKVEWHAAVFPGAQEYTDMCLGPDGLVYGLVGFSVWEPAQLEYGKRFFVFDPARQAVVHEADTEAQFGLVGYQQGPRHLLVGPDGAIYVLFLRGIARVDPGTHELSLLAESPVPVKTGGDTLDGRIYFSSGSRLCSFRIPPTGAEDGASGSPSRAAGAAIGR